jgi:hypothetical protein
MLHSTRAPQKKEKEGKCGTYCQWHSLRRGGQACLLFLLLLGFRGSYWRRLLVVELQAVELFCGFCVVGFYLRDDVDFFGVVVLDQSDGCFWGSGRWHVYMRLTGRLSTGLSVT